MTGMLPFRPPVTQKVWRTKGGTKEVKELVALLVFLAAWVFLQAYLLPKLGVPT
jgi:hypothetical protein